MNSINSDRDRSEKCLNFIVVPQVKTKTRESGLRGKKQRMGKSKENILIYIHMHIYTRTHKHIYTYAIHIYTYTIAYYLDQIVFFIIMFESIQTFHFFDWVRQAVSYRGTSIRIFCPMLVSQKAILILAKLFLVSILQCQMN